MTNIDSKDTPKILLIDSCGFDGSSQPEDILVQEALEMIENRHQKRETLAQKAILSVDSSGFDGGSVPDDVSKTVAFRMLENRRKKRELLAQESATALSAPSEQSWRAGRSTPSN